MLTHVHNQTIQTDLLPQQAIREKKMQRGQWITKVVLATFHFHNLENNLDQTL